MLVYEDVVKFHNHNKYKIYEPYASFNVQKCECACFSPLGDKVIVGSQSKILIIDFYTMEIFKVLSPNILNKRTMKQAKFISTFDLLV